jgi:membrane-bound lytic murein transglycosylase D
MLRAKNSLGTYEKIYQEYDGAHFGFASRNFYAEFLAAREIAKNYRRYFTGLRLDDPVQTKVVSVQNSINIKVVANHFKVDIPTLAELNPALLEPIWDGRRYVPKGYNLRLPQTVVATDRLAAALPAVPVPQALTEQRPSQLHRVKRGDTLLAIAEHYEVSVQALIAHNQLGRGAVIKVGQELQIPSLGDSRSSKKPKPKIAQENGAGK